MRRELSEATLDALAATRSSRSLGSLIAEHRLMYALDLYIPRLAATEPPVFTDGKTGQRSSDEMSMLGPTLSWPLTRLITSQYGGSFPWLRALTAQRENCRRTHASHQGRTEWRGSLCSQLVTFVIRRGFSLDAACQVLGVTVERSAGNLRNALVYIEEDIDRQRKRAEAKSKPHPAIPDWRDPKHEHHSVPGLHLEDCNACLRQRLTGSATLPAIEAAS